MTANGKTLYYNQCTQERNMMMFPCDMFLIDDICIEFYDGNLKVCSSLSAPLFTTDCWLLWSL